MIISHLSGPRKIERTLRIKIKGCFIEARTEYEALWSAVLGSADIYVGMGFISEQNT
jgi:hypothetical protein